MLADANHREDAPSRQRLSSPERRAAIVSAAMELFSQRGFRGTTTRELAAAVGVSEPVLYQHFATKKDLYDAIIDEMIAEVERLETGGLERLAGGSDDEAFFRELARLLYEWYVQENHHVRVLLFSSLEGHGLSEIWHEKVDSRFLPFIERYIGRRAAEGAFAVASPAIATRAFLSLVGHFGLMTTVFGRRLTGVEPQTVLDEFVQIFLQGIRRH